MTIASVLFCLPLSLLPLAAQETGATASAPPVPAEARERLSSLASPPLPARAAAQAAAEFYTASNLYQYMDGGADIFLLYDFQTLFHQEFQAGKADVTVDVFDMGTPLEAFGIYSAERSPKYTFITIGAEGYRNEGIVNFLQDRYYVKLAAFGDGADAALAQFANTLSDRIGGSRAMPDLINRLPAENRKAHSEIYMRKDPLGHAFLSPAYQADYVWNGVESRLLISAGRDTADAQGRLEKLTAHFRQSGTCQSAPEFGEGAIRANNSYEGTLIARAKGTFLVLLLNPAKGSEVFFKDVTGRLP